MFFTRFFIYIFRIIKASIVMRNGWVWGEERPSIMLREKMQRTGNLKIKKKSKIVLLNFERLKFLLQKEKFLKLKFFNNKIFYYHLVEQEIIKNSVYENFLLEKSLLHFFPHEVCQLKMVTVQGIKYLSPLFHGGERKIMNNLRQLKQLKKWIYELSFKARKDGLDISYLELNHTHPSLEYIIYNKKNDQTQIDEGEDFMSLNLHSLSASDIKTGVGLFHFFNIKIILKAITPSGHYFKKIIEDG